MAPFVEKWVAPFVAALIMLPSNGILNCRQVREHEGLDLGEDANIISDRRDAIHNRTVLSPFGFGKGERWHSRSEGLTRCDCYEGIGLGVISRRDGDRVKR